MKRLFAHLCTWFSTPDVSGLWEMWNSDYKNAEHDPDIVLKNGRRDIAAFGYPLTEPYDSADAAIIRWQLSLMCACGIDGVIVDWDGRRINPHRHQKFLKLLEIINEFPLKIAVCFEEWAGYYPLGTYKTKTEGAEAALEELAWLKENVINKGLYEERNGRFPVLVFRKMPGHMFGETEWRRIKASPVAADMDLYFEDCYDPTLKGAADGWFFWVGGFDGQNKNDLDFRRRAVESYFSRVKEIGGKPVCMSVTPGFDDTCVWGWGGGKRVAPRYGGRRYRECWEYVTEKDFDFVQIVTWNDWNEGSHIEPSESFGYKYLLDTARFCAAWKGAKCALKEEDLKRITDNYLSKRRK